MNTDVLAKLFEHNHWGNLLLLDACAGLSDEQLDVTGLTPSEWSIRRTLSHLVEAEQGYVSLLTIPPDERSFDSLPYAELRDSADRSGKALLALVRGDPSEEGVVSLDGYLVQPWVVLVQAINHGAEHRRQICGMLRALEVEPPRLDGWGFGEALGGIVPVSS